MARGSGRQFELASATHRRRLRPRRAPAGFGDAAGGDQKSTARSGSRGGAAWLGPLRREQGAGSQGEDPLVPWPFALAHDRPFANQQVPGGGGTVRDDSKRGQLAPGGGAQSAGRASGE